MPLIKSDRKALLKECYPKSTPENLDDIKAESNAVSSLCFYAQGTPYKIPKIGTALCDRVNSLVGSQDSTKNRAAIIVSLDIALSLLSECRSERANLLPISWDLVDCVLRSGAPHNDVLARAATLFAAASIIADPLPALGIESRALSAAFGFYKILHGSRDAVRRHIAFKALDAAARSPLALVSPTSRLTKELLLDEALPLVSKATPDNVSGILDNKPHAVALASNTNAAARSWSYITQSGNPATDALYVIAALFHAASVQELQTMIPLLIDAKYDVLWPLAFESTQDALRAYFVSTLVDLVYANDLRDAAAYALATLLQRNVPVPALTVGPLVKKLALSLSSFADADPDVTLSQASHLSLANAPRDTLALTAVLQQSPLDTIPPADAPNPSAPIANLAVSIAALVTLIPHSQLSELLDELAVAVEETASPAAERIFAEVLARAFTNLTLAENQSTKDPVPHASLASASASPDIPAYLLTPSLRLLQSSSLDSRLAYYHALALFVAYGSDFHDSHPTSVFLTDLFFRFRDRLFASDVPASESLAIKTVLRLLFLRHFPAIATHGLRFLLLIDARIKTGLICRAIKQIAAEALAVLATVWDVPYGLEVSRPVLDSAPVIPAFKNFRLNSLNANFSYIHTSAGPPERFSADSLKAAFSKSEVLQTSSKLSRNDIHNVLNEPLDLDALLKTENPPPTAIVNGAPQPRLQRVATAHRPPIASSVSIADLASALKNPPLPSSPAAPAPAPVDIPKLLASINSSFLPPTHLDLTPPYHVY